MLLLFYPKAVRLFRNSSLLSIIHYLFIYIPFI